MTAEIAILNKTAVALAADSAVTISIGSREEKVFDTAEKLFELSAKNPISIMLYNGMSFAEVPLPILIKEFVNVCPKCDRLAEAADLFLKFLNDKYVKNAPIKVKENAILPIIEPLFRAIDNYVERTTNERIVEYVKRSSSDEDIKKVFSDIINEAISINESILSGLSDAQFYGEGPIRFDGEFDEFLRKQVKARFSSRVSNRQSSRIFNLAKTCLRKDQLSDACTGLVIAGFGTLEIFPTLVSYEIDGFVCGRLKYKQVEFVDIRRSGKRAKVIPFAQKEMVERFLYGLDEQMQELIVNLLQSTVSAIPKQIFERLSFTNQNAKVALEMESQAAEKEFVESLKKDAFDAIRLRSQAEIDDMVEFMPKPELADMAEALVNLTSLKRRVSRGMETVGGPIDVAIISKSEGFVWVKRKHYFPTNLNPGYFNRAFKQADKDRDVDHATTSKS